MHLSDEQLNEYLDHESSDRALIESHTASCVDCAARLAALQVLFQEIESLPDLELSHSIAAHLSPSPNRSAHLPRSLTLTVSLQAALAAIAIIVAAPLVMQSVSPYLSRLTVPSIAEVFMQLQIQWTVWLERLSMFQFPAIPEIPVVEISSLFILLAVIGAFLFWLIGNGLLLRNQLK